MNVTFSELNNNNVTCINYDLSLTRNLEHVLIDGRLEVNGFA